MASLHNIVPDMPKMSAPIISPVDWKVKFEESLKAVDRYKALYEKADMRQNQMFELLHRYHNMMCIREEALKRCQEELEEAKKHVEMFSWPGEFSCETEEMEMETATDEMETGSETEEMETATDEMETATDEMETATDEMES